MFTFNHFGKVATFDDRQAIVVRALVNDYLKIFCDWVHADIAKEELEKKLRQKENELQELQAIVDASISNLDPDRR